MFRLLLLIPSSLFLFSCASSSYNISNGNIVPNINKTYSTSELETDLTFLLKTSMNVHPSFFQAIDTSEFYSDVKNIIDSIKSPLSRVDFYKLISPLISKLKCSHAEVGFPIDEWNYFLKNDGYSFPYEIQYNKGIFVKSSYDKKSYLPNGTEILLINGIPADSLFQLFKRNKGGEKDSWRNIITSKLFKNFLWLYGICSPYKITYFDNNGIIKVLNTNGIKFNNNDSSNSILKAELASYSFKILPDSIGYINYRSMSNDFSDPFQYFLKRAFTEFQSKGCKGLIIDLRENSGGNSYYGELLLTYITDLPYKLSSRKLWKASKEFKEYMRSRIPSYIRWLSYPPAIWIAELFYDEAKMFIADDNEIVEIKYIESVPKSNPLRFKGKICFLIGPKTFSSAMQLANAVNDYKLAVLIGEETGGVVNSYGDIYKFYLPCTALQVSIPSALIIRANGNDSEVREVFPDIEVKQSSDTKAQVTDIVLEAARQWIFHSY